jgi:flagellin-like protein
MNNENRNDEAVSPVIATILMVAITVVLAGVLYVWASSLAGDSAGGSLDAYTFSDADAAGSMSDGSGDALVEITMTQGTDLNWAMLKVTIKVDGGTPQSCGEAGDDTTCTWTPYEGSGNDQAWEASEGITISEGNTNLCDGEDGGCSLEVTLTKKGTGSDADKVLATINAYADSSN